MNPVLSIHPNADKNQRFFSHFTLEGVHSSLANALRRVMISEVPTVGFRSENEGDLKPIDEKDIHVLQNTGALHNEFISQRLSMIPLSFWKDENLFITSTFDPKSKERKYIFRDPSKSVKRDKYQLNVVNRKSDTNLEVYSKDITIMDSDSKPECFQPDPTLGGDNYIIITKLKPSEKLHVHLQPSIGVGQENSLFSPVGTVSYKFVQDTDAKISEALQEKIKMVNEERIKKKIALLTEEEKTELERDFKLLDSKRIYKKDASGNATHFDFQVESNGGLYSLNIIEYAIEVLYHKILDITTLIQKDQSSYTFLKEGMMITRSPTRMVGYDITIPNEDHTLGNLVAKYMQMLYLREDSAADKKESVFEFISYQKPHPLENKIIFRFQLLPSLISDNPTKNESTVVQYFVETLEQLLQLIGSRYSTETSGNSIYSLFTEQIGSQGLEEYHMKDVVTWISS